MRPPEQKFAFSLFAFVESSGATPPRCLPRLATRPSPPFIRAVLYCMRVGPGGRSAMKQGHGGRASPPGVRLRAEVSSSAEQQFVTTTVQGRGGPTREARRHNAQRPQGPWFPGRSASELWRLTQSRDAVSGCCSPASLHMKMQHLHNRLNTLSALPGARLARLHAGSPLL